MTSTRFPLSSAGSVSVWRISPCDDRAVNEHIRLFTFPPGDGAPTFWGGYPGVFLDPDGRPYEVAHNPRWKLGGDGSAALPR